MFRNAVLGLLLIAVVTTGVLIGLSFGSRWGAWFGFLVALSVGVPLVVRLYRRR
jgi:hypothetical protein